VACTVHGQILRDLGDPFAERNLDTARELYDQLLEKYPETADYWRGRAVCQRHLARLLHGAGRPEDARLVYNSAVASFNKALSLHAEDPFSQDGLARCHEHLGDLRLELGEDAEEDYAAALAIRRMLRETPEDRYRLALLWLKVGDADQAVKAMRELTTSVPENPNYWTLLGAAAFRAGDVEGSIDALENHQPAGGDGTHQFWLSMALWARGIEGDQERARAVYQSGIELMEENAPSRIEAINLRKEAARILGLTPSAQPEGDPGPETSSESE
jgi:tetratricopeptide (TPR) repeat protein